MTLRRADIVSALQAVIASAVLAEGVSFPPFDIDAEDLDGWRSLGGGLQDSANLLSGKFEVTIDSGPENQWEGVRDCSFAYGVLGADKAARTAQRDLAVLAINARLEADRTLGTGDPQVYAEIGETSEDDHAALTDTGVGSLAVITVNVTYVAASAAG